MKLITPSVTKNVGRIYIVLPFLKSLKIGESINRYVQDRGDIDIGTVSEILILNRVCGFNTPLYRIGKWAKEHGVDEIYGVEAEKLTDDRIGAVLDKIFLQRDTLDSQLSLDLVKEYDLKVNQIHFDPSSFIVKGKPMARSGDPKSVHVTYGRDGKGRVNQRQVRFGIATTDDGNIPLLGKAYSGNTTDSEMHPDFLKELREITGKSDFLFVADSKFDTFNNLMDISKNDGFFLCPGVFRENMKEAFLALQKEGKIEWQKMDYVAKEDKKKAKSKRPYYKAAEMEDVLGGTEENGNLIVHLYRLIYAFSSEKARVQKKTREKRIQRIRLDLEKIRRLLNKGNYTEKDYIDKKIAGALSRNEMGNLFKCSLIESNSYFWLDYKINKRELEKLENLDGVYILKTNLYEEDYPLNELFKIYKKQSRIEHRIKAVKGPLQLAPIFLKDPKRIAAMFFIIFQALKIYSIIEWETQKAIDEHGEGIPILPENRTTKTPSGETILKAFDNSVSILIYHINGRKFRKLTSPNDLQKLIFRLLCMRPLDLRSLKRNLGKFKNTAFS